jgi:colicin import membrane protein
MSWPENPGFAVSGGVHIGVLALALISFSQAPQLTSEQESIPVAIVSNEQLSQIMKGEKSAAEVTQRQRSEKIAEAAELTAKPSPADAPKDVAAPPSPLKRQPEPGQAAPHEAASPPQPSAALPPPPVQDSSKPALTSEPAKDAAATPLPQQQTDEDGLPTPSPPAYKKPAQAVPKFKPDQLAKLLEQEKQKETPKPAAKPKSGEEASRPQRKFDLGDIAKFLSKETPQQKQAHGRELSQLASLGAPAASDAKLSPSLWDQLDGLLQEQYKRCWSFSGLGGQQKYIPEIHVQYRPDGGLIGQPELLNPPSDPDLRALADSALRAVRRCDPLRIPAQYQPYYDQWKGRIVRFDPEEML